MSHLLNRRKLFPTIFLYLYKKKAMTTSLLYFLVESCYYNYTTYIIIFPKKHLLYQSLFIFLYYISGVTNIKKWQKKST